MGMFQGLAILLGLYIIFCLFEGKVDAKHGIKMVSVSREDSPGYYWIVMTIYTLLALAMFFIF